MGEAVTRRKQKIKRLLVEEAGECCAVCGYDRCIINLSFHHVDPSTKSFSLASNTTKSIAAYRDEVKKCVLVCANCHGEIETGLIPSPPAGATFATWSSLDAALAETGRVAVVWPPPKPTSIAVSSDSYGTQQVLSGLDS